MCRRSYIALKYYGHPTPASQALQKAREVLRDLATEDVRALTQRRESLPRATDRTAIRLLIADLERTL